MHDVLSVAPQDLRRAKLLEYEQYLIERDGEMDIDHCTLAKREVATEILERPPTKVRALDRDEFLHHYAKFDPSRPPSREMLMLLALTKVNAAEAYGVAQGYQRVKERALKRNDSLEMRVLCEEHYHTRILLSSAKCYGIEIDAPYAPPSTIRIMIAGMTKAPEKFARPLTMMSEIISTITFIKLIDINRAILKDSPETRDAIEERLIEVCIDEIGHVSYNRMITSAFDKAWVRMMLPFAVKSMARAVPEIDELGAFPHNIMQELPLLYDRRRLPEAVHRQSFLA